MLLPNATVGVRTAMDSIVSLAMEYNMGSLANVTTLMLLISSFTLCYTVAQSYFAKNTSRDGTEPPQVPYLVPLVGNTVSFTSNPGKFLISVMDSFKNMPVRIFVGAQTIYLVPAGELIQTVFKSSRFLNTEFTTIIAVRDALGLPPKELKDLCNDQSGIDQKPAAGYESMDANQRIFFQIHKQVHSHYSGKSLEALTDKYIEKLSASVAIIHRTGDGDDWVKLPDLCHFVRTEVFHATAEAFCGDSIFKLCPKLSEEFWEFDELLPKLVTGLPRIFARKAYKARDLMLANVKKWHGYGKENFDWSDAELVNCGWEPTYGPRIMRSRQQLFRDLGNSDDANASYDLGLIWAASGNVITASFWCIFFILQDSAAKDAILAEIDSCFPGADSSALDSAKLYTRPLLLSAYMETLRLSVASPITRVVRTPEFRLSKWSIKKDAMLLATSWVAGRNESFWSQGRIDPQSGEPEHPVSSFWAKRFLQFEDDPFSGPVKKTDDTNPASTLSASPSATQPPRDKTPKVVETGLNGYYFPYGGGPKMCPGRFFAKRNILLTVALMLREFEFELVDAKMASVTRPGMPLTPVGTVRPDREIPFKIRRRQRG